MAQNTPSAYGTDLLCIDDADELFSDVTGIQVVAQDAYHRLTNDTVLGEGGEDWGYDVTKLLGMTTAQIAAMPPTISAALQKDERIQAADVTITQNKRVGSQLWSIIITAICYTAEGPFTLILGVSDLTVAILAGSNG